MLLSAAVSLLSRQAASGQGTVGIGLPFRTQAPNAKAVLHIEADPANPQGVLLPRLNRTRLVGLTTAENGMLLYDPSDNAFHYWLADRWMPLAPASNRQTWLSGTVPPDAVKGNPGDFYYQTDTRDLYQKNEAGAYVRLLTLEGDRFWQSASATATHTTRNVGIGIADPTERLVVDGAVAATSLQGPDTRLVLADAGGKLAPVRTGTGYLANDGFGNLSWQSVNTYTAGNGINISSGTIFNTGDTNLSDDITNSTAAGGDLTGFYPSPTIGNLRVTQAKLANNAVSTAKLVDGSVTQAKLANNSVGPSKIQPGTSNTFLSTNASGAVEWRAVGGSLPGTGQISIGNGTGVNQVPLSQDVTLATDGRATVRGLLGRPLDNAASPANGQVLVWDGTHWTYRSVDQNTYADGDVTGLLANTTVARLQNRPVAATAPATGDVLAWNGSAWAPKGLLSSLPGSITLEGLSYSTPQTRYYSVDPADFAETNTDDPHITLTGISGSSAAPDQRDPGYMAAPLHLPHKATITSIRVHCFNDASNAGISASLVQNNETGTATAIATGTTNSGSGNQTITLSSLPVQIDCQTYSYKIVVNVNDKDQRVHGVRITYTVNSPD